MEIKYFFIGIYKGYKYFGECVSSLINLVAFSLTYFLGVGITSIIGKLIENDFISDCKNEVETYWVNSEISKKNKLEDYYKQF